jgi:hypothetical protein
LTVIAVSQENRSFLQNNGKYQTNVGHPSPEPGTKGFDIWSFNGTEIRLPRTAYFSKAGQRVELNLSAVVHKLWRTSKASQPTGDFVPLNRQQEDAAVSLFQITDHKSPHLVSLFTGRQCNRDLI